MVKDDDFSYANLRDMWSQRDKEAKPLKVDPVTSTTPLRLAARSPDTKSFNTSKGKQSRNKEINKFRPVPVKSNQMKRLELKMQSKVSCTFGAHLQEEKEWSNQGELEEPSKFPNLGRGAAEENKSHTSIDTNSDEENIQPTRLLAHGDESCRPGRDDIDIEQVTHESFQETEPTTQYFDDSYQHKSFQGIEHPKQALGPTQYDESHDPFQGMEPDEMEAAFSVIPPSNAWDVNQTQDHYDNFDPYDNFDSGSAVDSEITVKVENSRIQAMQNVREKRQGAVLEDQFEAGSNIPDSAFLSMAAKLTSNITGLQYKKNNSSRAKVDTAKINLVAAPACVASPMHTISELDNGCSNDVSNFGSFFHHPQQGPQNGSPVAESDIFDGLSEIGSSIPAFGRRTLPSVEKEKLLQSPKQESKYTNMANRNKDWSAVVPVDEDWVPERSEEAKQKLSENLAAFAKTSPKKDDKLLDGKMKLKIPSPRFKKEILEFPNLATSSKEDKILVDGKMKLKIPSPRRKEETLEFPDPLDSVCEDSDSSDEDKSPPFNSSLGISRIDQNVTPSNSAQIIKDLSHHFDLLTNSPKMMPLKAKMSMKSISLVPNIKDDEDLFNQDIKYAEKYDEAADIVASVTWIPSILRLHKRNSTADSSNNGANRDQLQSSPSSVVRLNEENAVTPYDCMFSGFKCILLQFNQAYGGTIQDPASIIQQMEAKVDSNVIRKLQCCIDENSGVKRITAQGRKKEIFDKAIEIHERALLLLEEKNLEEVIEVYEAFFECYSTRDFLIDDEEREKQIIAIFLFNMGMTYLMINECELAMEFLIEGLSTVIDEDAASREIAIMLNGIGITRFASGEFEEALTEFEDSLALWQDLEERSGIIRTLNNIGSTCFALDELNSALSAFDEALELHRAYLVESFGPRTKYKQTSQELEDALEGVSDTLCNMAFVYSATGATATAIFYLEEALRIQKTLHNAAQVEEIINMLSLLKPPVEDSCEI